MTLAYVARLASDLSEAVAQTIQLSRMIVSD
jgi:hypothetical protein